MGYKKGMGLKLLLDRLLIQDLAAKDPKVYLRSKRTVKMNKLSRFTLAYTDCLK